MVVSTIPPVIDPFSVRDLLVDLYEPLRLHISSLSCFVRFYGSIQMNLQRTLTLINYEHHIE
jgi:hypothetical protein